MGYKFSYDGVNRLANAEGINGYSYKETISGYDKNGNITGLQRYNGGTQWDNLSYNYNGNRLTRVTDGGNSDGFNNDSSGGNDDYAYDGNGNTTQDLNRDISSGSLRYNYLNLVREVVVSGKTLQYYYDGSGAKLRMSNSNGAVNTKYAGTFEYDASNYLTRIATEEGQISVTNNGNIYSTEYYLKDHLGNVRMVLNEAGGIIQETEYFPFGLAIPRTNSNNKYLYNGREKQPETGWLDYGARMYDAGIGRWAVVDPMSDFYPNVSPMVYCLGNPLSYIDPNGMNVENPTEDEKKPNFGNNSSNVFKSTHTDDKGNVLFVENDGDNGIYKHKQGESEKDVRNKYSHTNTSAGGKKMGETEYWDEFAPDGQKRSGAKIEFNRTWDNEFNAITDYAENLNLLELQGEQEDRGIVDIKSHTPAYSGRLFQGKYITTRSLGNIMAGYTTKRSSLGIISLKLSGYIRLAGYYNMNHSLPHLAKFSLLTGWTPYPPPYYGEAEYTGRMIIKGWTNIKK